MDSEHDEIAQKESDAETSDEYENMLNDMKAENRFFR